MLLPFPTSNQAIIPLGCSFCVGGCTNKTNKSTTSITETSTMAIVFLLLLLVSFPDGLGRYLQLCFFAGKWSLHSTRPHFLHRCDFQMIFPQIEQSSVGSFPEDSVLSSFLFISITPLALRLQAGLASLPNGLGSMLFAFHDQAFCVFPPVPPRSKHLIRCRRIAEILSFSLIHS